MSCFTNGECVFYQIYPLGFCGAPKMNTGEAPVNRLKMIEDYIPHLRRLYINAVYLGPLFESDSHGYDTRDYRLIDNRLGTNEDMKSLCKKLRDNDIHIVLDGVFNHTGRGFFAFQDVLKNRENSRYCSWFSNLRFDMNNSYGDNLHYDSWAGHERLVKLNLSNPEVREYLLSAVDMWIDEFKIDGLRLDAADCIDREFFKELRRRTTQKNPDFWLMGEIIHGDYNCWANPEMLHSVTNYECYKGLYSSILSRNLFEIDHSIERQYGEWGLYKGLMLYNFADNHDVDRLASVLESCPKDIKSLYTILYTMPGLPSLYYGSEWGIKGRRTNNCDDDLRPAIDVHNLPIEDRSLMDHIAALGAIRIDSKALCRGSFKTIQITNEHLVFARRCEDDCRIVYVNLKDEPIYVCFEFEGRQYQRKVAAHSSNIIKS